MFTGIIVELGKVVSLEKKTDMASLTISAPVISKETNIGDSISINGVCLTVTEIISYKSEISFDISFQTLRNTNLGELRRGDIINLEPALKLSSRLGGHFVTGHIDGVGIIKSKTFIGNAFRIEIGSPENILKFLVSKGSVAVDGISLTIVDVLRDAFSVVIIPHTAKMTTLGFKKEGDKVNIEVDILARYVEKFLIGSELSLANNIEKDTSLLSALKRSGFITD